MCPRKPRARRPAPPRPTPDRVPVLGLTGGIGAGKSTALAALEELGAATLSSDRIVHDLYAEPAVRDAVVGRWGPDVAPGGTVDRAAVARHAFADPRERGWLEGLLWPLVAERMARWRAGLEARRPRPPAGVIEVPLLFESGLEGGFDATIAVVADESLRRARAGSRGHAALDERSARQLGQDEKASRATFVVRNDGTERELAAKLSPILAKLKE
ncbi:MAG: dephospho-CoA kinase [Solirubrobacteraceae bacterium]